MQKSLRHISRKHDDYKIVTDCEELVLARMDVRLIIQVLVNLIDNAIKYTPPGSVICIRGIKTDGKAQISVEDNGPGIPDEMKPHIFEMFYTGKTSDCGQSSKSGAWSGTLPFYHRST